MVFEINDIFHFHKIQDGGQNSEKSKFFKGLRGVVLGTLGVQNLRVIIPWLKFKVVTTQLPLEP